MALTLGSAQASASPSQRVAATGESYQGVEYCAKCHPEEKAKWDDSLHSIAYSDPNFQDEWKKEGSPTACLQCHTTGFSNSTGTYKARGVTCEQCHGPGNTMKLDSGVGLCATCHTGPYPTYNEWLRSGPGHSGATCSTCHASHTEALKGENSTVVCSQCHSDIADRVDQTKHGAAGLECKVCHMYKSPPNFQNNTPGITGHTFFMTSEQLDCTTCHGVKLDKHNVLGVGSSACLSCHGDIHDQRLKLINGTTYPLNDPVALCGECHNERLLDWEQGTHGSATVQYAPCTDCHNPHKPIIAGIATVASLPQRESGPAEPTEQITILAVAVIALLGVAIIGRRV